MRGVMPMKDRLLVRRITEPRRKGNLIATPKEVWQYRAGRTWADAHVGEIVAVGPGRIIDGERVPLDAQPGQMCVFGRFTDWESSEGDLCMIQEADIIGIITGPVRVSIDKFTHNEVGVERTPGSLEDLYSDAH